MKKIACCIFREGNYYVAQCLNVDVSSFGDTREQAAANLREAVELYFEDAPAQAFVDVTDAVLTQELINA